jgi:hypothetical protein
LSDLKEQNATLQIQVAENDERIEQERLKYQSVKLNEIVNSPPNDQLRKFRMMLQDTNQEYRNTLQSQKEAKMEIQNELEKLQKSIQDSYSRLKSTRGIQTNLKWVVLLHKLDD